MATYREGSVGDTIQKLGGAYKVAASLGVSPPAVFNMMATGAIPARHYCVMLQICVAAGLPWRPPGWDSRIQLRVDPRRVAELVPQRERGA